MLIVIFKIIFLLGIFYILGNLIFKIFSRFKIFEKNFNSVSIKFLVSIILVNNLILFGIKLDYIIILFCFIIFISIYNVYLYKLSLKLDYFQSHIRNKNNIIFLITSIFLFIKVIIDPVQLWDARSIWFYSGKIIYFNNQYLLENFQNDFCKSCLFLIYPKLIPILSAFIAKIMGFWNDYLTKISLFLILLPSLIFLKNEFKSHITFLLSLLLIIFSNGFYIWNGYIDGYLSIYSCLMYYSLINYINYKDNRYLILTIIFLAICINLKIESLFLIFSSLVLILVTNNLKIIRKCFSTKIGPIVLFFLSPSLIWILMNYFNAYNFSSHENSIYSFANYLNAIFESNEILASRYKNYISYVFDMTLNKSKVIYFFMLIFIIKLLDIFNNFLNLSWKKLLYLQILPVTYLTIIIIFYLYIGYSYGLPSMKDWILASFDRYTLPVKGLLSINLIFLFDSIKNDSFKKII